MKQKVIKPIVIGNDSDVTVSIQIASVKVNDKPSVSQICILFEDGDGITVPAFFTSKQIDILIAKLRILKEQIQSSI